MSAPEDQVIYKLGSLEASVKSLSEQFSDGFKSLEKKLDEASAGHNAKNAEVKIEVAALTRRVVFLENWRQQLFTKMGFVVSAVSVFWLVFGKAIETTIAGIFH